MFTNFGSDALRTIGRDLDWRGIRTFLIRSESKVVVVEGGYQSPPAVTPVTLHYASSDIERLEREARERNDHVSPVMDFRTVSQILWATATYVSGKNGRLVSISNTASTCTMPVLKIEYETAHGDRVVNDLAGSAIYELCVKIYKVKGTSNIDMRRYTRFSDLHEGDVGSAHLAGATRAYFRL